MSKVWSDLHHHYGKQDWVNKPSMFAETAITYFPEKGKILELGAGHGQDSKFFAEQGYEIVSTDIEEETLKVNKEKLSGDLQKKVIYQKLDLREPFEFDDGLFDVVYAHLSIHYFDRETTRRLIDEIQRVLKPGGVLAFFVNSVNDPEYGNGQEIEKDFFQIKDATKRYFSIEATRELTQYLDVVLLDDHGETYKDSAKGVHNLIRFIGVKRKITAYTMAIPFCGGIVERVQNGEKELLLQTRWQPYGDPVYSGALEFPVGKLDKPYEDVHDTVAREIKEEAGLTLRSIRADQRTEKVSNPDKDDAVIGFRPFCCTQQLKNGKPWIGFIFVCEVESDQEPTSQLSETKDAQWMEVEAVKKLYQESPEKFFTLELPAWGYYFDELSK